MGQDLEAPAGRVTPAGREDLANLENPAGRVGLDPVGPGDTNQAAPGGMADTSQADRVVLAGLGPASLGPADTSRGVQAGRDRGLTDRGPEVRAVRDLSRNRAHPRRGSPSPAHPHRNLPDPDPTAARLHRMRAHRHRIRAHPPVPIHLAEAATHPAEAIHLAEAATHPAEATREADAEGAKLRYCEFSS